MTTALIIRPATPSDRPLLRRAIVELQDYERLRHPTRLPGEPIADAYLDWMQRQAESQGTVLVAEHDGCFAGFVAGWIVETASIAETPDSNRFGLISDICVMPVFRGQRIATRLLDALGNCLGRAGATRLRITWLATNTSAQASYQYAGFVPYEVLYEKPGAGNGYAMTTEHSRLLIFGLGFCGTAVAGAACAAGFSVTGTMRHAIATDVGPGSASTVPFDAAAPAIAVATHLLSTVPPEAQRGAEASMHGDPVLARYAEAIAVAPHLRWIGYLSSTVVYGDRAGGWVDEDTPPAPSQERGHRRLAAETAWSAFAGNRAVDVFRLAGIYGPGRSAFDTIRSAQARRIVKPGHAFGRIHRDDIAAATLSAMRQDRPPGRRILNLADDTPAEAATVIEEAANLLGVPAPQAVAFADVEPGMSPLARSFWAENRKIASRKTQATLGLAWRYPSYREGLRAILREEQGREGLT